MLNGQLIKLQSLVWCESLFWYCLSPFFGTVRAPSLVRSEPLCSSSPGWPGILGRMAMRTERHSLGLIDTLIHGMKSSFTPLGHSTAEKEGRWDKNIEEVASWRLNRAKCHFRDDSGSGRCVTSKLFGRGVPRLNGALLHCYQTIRRKYNAWLLSSGVTSSCVWGGSLGSLSFPRPRPVVPTQGLLLDSVRTASFPQISCVLLRHLWSPHVNRWQRRHKGRGD